MEKITAIIMIEMMGKPADYLKETLSKFIDRIAIEKGIKIINRKLNEPKPVDDSDLFSTFAEVEMEFDGMQQIINLIFTYMPSHIEIISPAEMRMKNFEFNSLCNELTRRLLEYDAIAKKMMFEKGILENQLKKAGINPGIGNIIQEIRPEEKKVKKTRKKKIKSE